MRALVGVLLTAVVLLVMTTASFARLVEYEEAAAVVSLPAVIDSQPAEQTALVAWAPGALLVR